MHGPSGLRVAVSSWKSPGATLRQGSARAASGGGPRHSDLGVSAGRRWASPPRLPRHPASRPAGLLQEAEACGPRQDGWKLVVPSPRPLFPPGPARALLACAPGAARSPARAEGVSLVFCQIPVKFCSKVWGDSHEFSRLWEGEPPESARHLPGPPAPPRVDAEATWLRSPRTPTPARPVCRSRLQSFLTQS